MLASSLDELKSKDSSKGGTRLVNAQAVEGQKEFPFVSAYFMHGKAEMARGLMF
jgi:hypothetical protein